MMCHVWLTDDEASGLRETDVCEGTTTQLTPPFLSQLPDNIPLIKIFVGELDDC